MIRVFLQFVLIACTQVVLFAEVLENRFFFDVAFTYWHASEEGLSLGRSGDFLISDDPYYLADNTLLVQPFEYSPGWKASLGIERNDWGFFAEYTWVSNTISQTSNAPYINPGLGNGVWVIAPWFLQVAADGGSLSATKVSSQWDLRMNIADLTLQNTFLRKGRFVFSAFGGLRAAWIKQSLSISITEPDGLFLSLPEQPITSSNTSKCWSIGPRLGAFADILLGYGFFCTANGATALLYTDYTTLTHAESAASVDPFPANSFSADLSGQRVLRPMLECGLGIGWQRSFEKSGSTFRAFAAYDFMQWWNQNMLREMMGSLWNGTSTSGDLSLHGVTLTASLDF